LSAVRVPLPQHARIQKATVVTGQVRLTARKKVARSAHEGSAVLGKDWRLAASARSAGVGHGAGDHPFFDDLPIILDVI